MIYSSKINGISLGGLNAKNMASRDVDDNYNATYSTIHSGSSLLNHSILITNITDNLNVTYNMSTLLTLSIICKTFQNCIN